MSDDNSEEYYLNREQQERVLADAATDQAIAAIHNDMAQRYSDLAAQAGKGQGRSRLSVRT